MEEFISRIIEIDRQARQLTVDPDALKAQADREIAQQNSRLKEQIDKQTESEIEQYRKDCTAAAEKTLRDKKEYYESMSAHFDDVYRQNGKAWEDELVRRTLRGE